MSSNMIEKVLWKINSDPEEANRYRDDPEAYLQNYRVDDEERELLLTWDVSTLAARDVSPLLLLSAHAAVKGVDKVPEYIQKIHQPPKGSARSA